MSRQEFDFRAKELRAVPAYRSGGFGIGEAVEMLLKGMRVTRIGWNGANQFLAMQLPNTVNGPMTLPFIFITTVTADTVPWAASQTDLLAEDWQEYL